MYTTQPLKMVYIWLPWFQGNSKLSQKQCVHQKRGVFLLDYYLDERGMQILDFMHKECECETYNVSKVIIIRQHMCCNNGLWYDGFQFVTFLIN